MMLTGKTVDAKRAKRMGIVDEAVPPRIMENTARGVLNALPAPRRLSFAQGLTLNALARRLIAAQARRQVARRARREHYPAPYAILDLFVKHDGDALAAPSGDPASITTLLRTPTAGNLIRVFRLQERLKSLGKEGTFVPQHVHVVGAGTMGGDIAAWCALRGLTVTLQDQDAARLAPAMGRAAKLFRDRLRDERRVRDALDRLVPDVAGHGMARADVVIEAIFENVEAKRALFADVERKAKPEAILATNTSSIPLEDIAGALAEPSRLCGIHFFNPVARMMLVEVVVGTQTRREVVADAAAFVRAIDKLPLPVKSAPGFLVNRILAPYMVAAFRAVDEGIAPEAIDEAALAFGMPMGPIELADTVGLDIAVAVGKLLGGGGEPPRKLMELVAAGHLGKKSGRGFYAWTGGRPAKQTPGVVPAGLADRLVEPFVAEAQAALAQGIVGDADLIDAGAIFGTGFAPFRGGPLHYAAGRRSEGTPATAERVALV
jgi:3-hydroxyacyl-CoA dehydrogenase/enoyl-CoA hydratase/3-hydroxybutyryl-CoA epimerase